MQKNNYIRSEDDEQKALVEYLELRHLKFTAIPNSTFTRSWAVKMRNKALGLRPGLPDLIVISPANRLLFIEMKRVKGGVVSEFQKSWIEALGSCPGIKAVVCKGADEAIKFIKEN
ncbi:MAG: VRR-NUC domain-containing protein [Candidatus Komeilibacteria bacterium]|nr:VRR-NUC domain-containing protein [Candidatus Komeilibacteria bacterium]